MFKLKFSCKKQGFTLGETLIAIVIAGILTSIAAPNLVSGYQKQKVKNVSEQLKSYFKQAQKFAIRKGKGCAVKLNQTTNKITSTAGCLVDPDIDIKEDLHQVDIKTNITGNPASIEFTYRGNIEYAAETTESGDEDQGTFVISLNGTEYKSCVVMTEALGIIRNGYYDGSTSEISSGNCISN
jgi:prepilin-type N-terminal cleavage/methylation domain-containing protein